MATTYTDVNVDTLRINKLTKQEYDNLPEHSSTELYLVPEEVDSVVTENSTNPVQSGAVFNAIADIHSTAPLGAIMPYASSTIPSCWMLCDGSAISRTDYAELFSLIGTAYGVGDGSTTFNIPDLREVVPVGAGTSTRTAIATHDSYTLGEFKDDQFENHAHNMDVAFAGGEEGYKLTYSDETRESGTNDTVSGWNSARYGTTTHGKQLGVNYIIRVLKGSSETPETPVNYNNIPIVFTEALTKSNVVSGDTLAELFGKIQKWFNTPTMKANSNYVSSGDKVVLTIKKSLIPYYQAACFMVTAMGNAYGSVLLRVNHGDAWSATIDEITNTVALSVSSVDGSDTANVVVKLACGISGSNKYTFHPLSGIDIISIGVE